MPNDEPVNAPKPVAEQDPAVRLTVQKDGQRWTFIIEAMAAGWGCLDSDHAELRILPTREDAIAARAELHLQVRQLIEDSWMLTDQ